MQPYFDLTRWNMEDHLNIWVVSANNAEGEYQPCSGSSDGGSSIQPTKIHLIFNLYFRMVSFILFSQISSNILEIIQNWICLEKCTFAEISENWNICRRRITICILSVYAINHWLRGGKVFRMHSPGFGSNVYWPCWLIHQCMR